MIWHTDTFVGISSQGNIADLEDSHPAESMDDESAYSMSEASECVRRGKKRVRRNVVE